MQLKDLGYNQNQEAYRTEHHLDSFEVGRVTSQHKDRYIVQTESNELESELIGNLRYSAANKNDLPSVGDWVALSEYDEGKALIHAVFPRKSILQRKAIGKLGQSQIIATNIDFGLIVQSINRDFNINRLERYITICNASNIVPLIVLSKVDLISQEIQNQILNQVTTRISNVPIFAISNLTMNGIEALQSQFVKGKTYCLLGSSGVGKSTLINTLIGINLMNTGEISEKIDRGKHVTTHRELIVSENGILIDNPGMREVGITGEREGFEVTFDEVMKLSTDCRFKNCSHTTEVGCAILKALEDGGLDNEQYSNFFKMRKEQSHYESNAQERRKKDKEFGKMIKGIQKERRNKKY